MLGEQATRETPRNDGKWAGAAACFFALVCACARAGLPAAEFYSTQHDFARAYPLWQGVLKSEPSQLTAVLRVAELNLLFASRREARETLLGFLDEHRERLTPLARRQIREKNSQLQSTFLTDEGQSQYYQGVSKAGARDYDGALALLAQASAFEVGNLRILKEKARCERAQGQWQRLYETLKTAGTTDPYDASVREQLMEAHIHFRDFPQALALHKVGADTLNSARQRMAYGVALFESGAADEARQALEPLLEQGGYAGAPHPIVYFALGRVLSGKAGFEAVAASYLERFETLVSAPDLRFIDGWDPYQTDTRLAEARSLRQSLRGKP